MKMIYKILLATGILLGALACGPSGDSEAPAAAPPDERVAVRTVPVVKRQAALPIHASGILTSSAEQRLSFKTGGVIQRIYVDEGSSVRPGQLLAALDKTEIDAQVSQAEQALGKAERDLGRVQGLYRDSSATLELVENATTARDVARETARIASFNRRYAEIRATRGGKIIKKLMNEGEITGPGLPVLVLFETGKNDWVVRIQVSDRDWAQLRPGLAARVTLDAYPGVPFNGQVDDLAPAAEPTSGLYNVDIRLSPGNHRLAPGLFATVDVSPVQAAQYAVIPVEALVEGEGQSAFVFTIDGETVRKVPVKVAFLDGDQAVIASGLENVTEVVTTGAPYLNEKKKVKKM